MTENYIELLERPEWKLKRKEILERDNHTCQRCGVNESFKLPSGIYLHETYLELVQISPDEFHNPDSRNIRLILDSEHKGLLLKSPCSFGQLDESPLFMITNLVSKNFIRYPFRATHGIVHFDETVHSVIAEDPYLKKMNSSLNDHNLELDLEGLYLIGYKQMDKYLNLKQNFCLHVHHLCYRKEVEIWEQPWEEYITLCNVCHQIIHDSQEIPFYDESGNDISSQSSQCSKCYGSGYLPMYSYYMGGTCFECNGTGLLV